MEKLKFKFFFNIFLLKIFLFFIFLKNIFYIFNYMKIMIIPDIHGNWKNTIQYIIENKNQVDKIVTLGDYFDDFDEKLNGKIMIDGFNTLMKLKKAENEKFEILLGNHCLSYISNPNVSGHHYQYASAYKNIIMNNIDYIDIITKINDWYFSHAGVSKTWYEWFINNERIQKLNIEINDHVKIINTAFHSGFFGFFDYNRLGKDLGDGDSEIQGPLWIRPNSLIKSSLFDKQIVGHTELCKGKPLTVELNDGKKIMFTDSPTHDGYFIMEI